MIIRRQITPEDRNRVILAAIRRHKRVLRITPGIRRAIIGSAEYRQGHQPRRTT